MLRLNKLADYGTIVMVYLAKQANGLCNARDIAQQTHLSVPTVSKLLKRLTAAGLLSSVRGVAGGYQLKRPAAQISVAEIIYALDEARGLTECSVIPNTCALQGLCHVQANWQLISHAIESALASVDLATLSQPHFPKEKLMRIQELAMGATHE